MTTRNKLIVGFATLLPLSAIAWWLVVPVLAPPVPEESNRSTVPTPNETPSEPIQTRPQPTSTRAPTLAKLSPRNSADDTRRDPQRKFSEMGVLDRGEIMKGIRTKDTAELFQHFLDAGRVENDPMKQDAVRLCLADALRERPPNLVFLKKLQDFIESDEPSKFERRMMIGALSFAATKETVELLIRAAITVKDKEVRDSAIANLRSVGEVASSRMEKDDFTPKLTAVWFATSDPKTMRSSADSIARIGSASGVEVLLAAALAPDGKDDVRREKAAYGLLKVNQPSAVPPLAAVLETNPPGSQANTVAFRTLNQIGDKPASEAVMKWFQTTDSSAAAQAKEWATHVRTTAQDEAAQAALDPKVPFRSEENREALRAGLKAHRAGRTFR